MASPILPSSKLRAVSVDFGSMLSASSYTRASCRATKPMKTQTNIMHRQGTVPLASMQITPVLHCTVKYFPDLLRAISFMLLSHSPSCILCSSPPPDQHPQPISPDHPHWTRHEIPPHTIILVSLLQRKRIVFDVYTSHVAKVRQ